MRNGNDTDQINEVLQANAAQEAARKEARKEAARTLRAAKEKLRKTDPVYIEAQRERNRVLRADPKNIAKAAASHADPVYMEAQRIAARNRRAMPKPWQPMSTVYNINTHTWLYNQPSCKWNHEVSNVCSVCV